MGQDSQTLPSSLSTPIPEQAPPSDRPRRSRRKREGAQDISDSPPPRGDSTEAPAGERPRRSRSRSRSNRPSETREERHETRIESLRHVQGILREDRKGRTFLATQGYLPSDEDVPVGAGMISRLDLRVGDEVVGRAGRDLAEVLLVNGVPLEELTVRPRFYDLTPLHPTERLSLETSGNVASRVIDLVAPIGKGQRGLIVSPPKAGKTTVLQTIANAITTNNPECHLMVVLVDERPEEVTDMRRSVKGEVIASTFDRPASDHTALAELAVERAKRLVEMGMDVVILLDSITRLGRAYNLATAASGRILSGGVEASALYPPKKFLGAARHMEHGGSLTILATALVETGSLMDTVIFEEFKGTGNMELKLDRRLADKRVFPAVDIPASGTRREELLLDPTELRILTSMRRVLSGLDPVAAMDLLVERMKGTKSNAEFLLKIQKTLPSE